MILIFHKLVETEEKNDQMLLMKRSFTIKKFKIRDRSTIVMEVSKGSDSEDLKSDLDEDFEDVLKELPQVLEFIKRLQNHIRWQRKKINKLRNKLTGRVREFINHFKASNTIFFPSHSQKKEILLSREKPRIDSASQTESTDFQETSVPGENWVSAKSEEAVNIVEQVTKAAESALQQTGFVYEETSGLYYDYNTGYYYDAVRKFSLHTVEVTNQARYTIIQLLDRNKVSTTMETPGLITITTKRVRATNSTVRLKLRRTRRW